VTSVGVFAFNKEQRQSGREKNGFVCCHYKNCIAANKILL